MLCCDLGPCCLNCCPSFTFACNGTDVDEEDGVVSLIIRAGILKIMDFQFSLIHGRSKYSTNIDRSAVELHSHFKYMMEKRHVEFQIETRTLVDVAVAKITLVRVKQRQASTIKRSACTRDRRSTLTTQLCQSSFISFGLRRVDTIKDHQHKIATELRNTVDSTRAKPRCRGRPAGGLKDLAPTYGSS